MTKPIARLIKEELAWMREAQRDWGHILIDPHLINVARNPALKRLFSESELVKKDPDHWKLLLARVAPIVYPPPKAGPGRPVGWTPEFCHELLKDAYKLRLADPKKSIEKIAYELADSSKWKESKLVVDRERIQNLLADARAKVSGELAKIGAHSTYQLNQKGKLLRDIVWAFSKKGKAELIRRHKCGIEVVTNVS